MAAPRTIAFYLPQYHPIPENDKWWGKGFTDWVNVKKGAPRFFGHYQPHIPSELGYYDLRQEDIRSAQAELAAEYGIHGFCYYHYWFNGKMLLERPFNEVLESGKPDFPFCLCWANENWTRRWDGLDKEILMEQNYNNYNPEEHIKWFLKAFKDDRYIKINERPLLLIYNVSDIPNLKYNIVTWRKIVKENGFPDLYLCSVKSIHNMLSSSEIFSIGFDSISDFIPSSDNKFPKKIINIPKYFTNRLLNKFIKLIGMNNKVDHLPVTSVHNYSKVAQIMMSKQKEDYKFFPCVIPGWDNSARKRVSVVMQNDSSEIYKKWLKQACMYVKSYSKDEQIVFINAWNEWAEGCHLEPDLRNGRKFLEATLEVSKELSKI